MNTPMSAEQIKMTGAELKKIWKRAGREEEHLDEYLGISKSTWYNMVNKKANEPIPDHIEARVTKDEELIKWINLELTPKQPNQIEALDKAVSIYGETVMFIRDMMNFMKERMASDDAKFKELAASAASDRKSAEVFRNIVEGAQKEGRLEILPRRA